VTTQAGRQAQSRRVRGRARVARLLLAAATLAGCTSLPSGGDGGTPSKNDAIDAQGPLQLGGDPGTLCLPLRTPGAFAYGMDALRNTGMEPVTLERVELRDSSHVSLIDSLVVPLTETTLVGNWSSWPPPAAATRSVQWAERRTAAGTVLPAGSASAFNLVLHGQVDAGASRAGFATVVVFYSEDDHQYRAESSTQVQLRLRCV
jgi:hypothetical protein